MKLVQNLAFVSLLTAQLTLVCAAPKTTKVTNNNTQVDTKAPLVSYSPQKRTDAFLTGVASLLAASIVPASCSRYAFLAVAVPSAYTILRTNYTDQEKETFEELATDSLLYGALYAIPTLCLCAAIQYAKTAFNR